MEFLTEFNKKRGIGELYYTSARDEHDRAMTRFEGTVVGFIIRRDDGSEFEVRSEKPVPFAKVALTYDEMKELKAGDTVQSLKDNVKYAVVRVYDIYGDIWCKPVDGSPLVVKKYTDLRRANV